MDRALELLAVERLAPPGFLDHGELAQLHAFEGREAAAAGRTQPPAPDRRVVIGRPAVLHLGIVMSAERATHERGAFLGPSGIDRESPAEFEDAFFHALFG